jgi:hypothetical protein
MTEEAVVGSGECELCRRDANDANGITTTDALLVHRSAVGQDVELGCPACFSGLREYAAKPLGPSSQALGHFAPASIPAPF